MDIKRISPSTQFLEFKSKGAKDKTAVTDVSTDNTTDSIDIALDSQSSEQVINMTRVLQLKDKIESGKYEFNFEGIANAIIEIDG